MSTKVNTVVKSPRASAKKKASVKNTFDLVQFKKMVGKGMVKIWNGIVDKKLVAEESKKIKDKILSGSIKSIGMSGYINEGVLYIFDGVERLLIINTISYSDLKKASINVDVIINQYPKMSKEEVKSLTF